MKIKNKLVIKINTKYHKINFNKNKLKLKLF